MHAVTIPEQALHATVKFPQILPPAMRVAIDMKAAMSASMKGKSHDKIAARMSATLGRTVSVRMLYRFTAPSDEAKFPAAWIAAFCEATGDDALKRLILGPQLCELLELGERAAVILDERARRQLLKVPTKGPKVNERINGNGSCAR